MSKKPTTLTVREAMARGLVKNTSRVRRAIEAEHTAELIAAGHGERLENTKADFDAAVEAGDTARAKLIRARIQNLKRKSSRTKGLPYSRCRLLEVVPGRRKGEPGVFAIDHPTRKRPVTAHVATEGLMKVFMPSAPENIRKAMLGVA